MGLAVNIVDFGAMDNVTELQTEKLQKAIDYCFLNGGGEVIIPKGVFYTGDIRIRTDVTLHLLSGAVIKGSDNPEDYFNYLNDTIEPLRPEQITDAPYVHLSTIHGEREYDENKKEYRFKRIPGSRWNNAIIRAIDAHNIKIIGEKGSLIDGSNCFDDKDSEEDYRGPHGITLFNCTDIKLKGYTIKDTGNWAHNLLFCNNIDVEEITALAGHDGFDASVCNNITIKNSEFYTGDDCIAGFGNVNTCVSNCILNSSCSAMRYGGTNVFVEKCHIYGPGKYCFRGSLSDEEKRMMVPSVLEGKRNNMLSAFTYYSDYSLPINVQPENIVISDCKVENADRFLHYNYSGNETWQKNRPLKNIEFRNIKATGISMPITAYGDENIKISLKLSNVDLSVRDGFEDIDLMHVCHFDDITLENVNIKNFKGKTAIKRWSDGRININNVIGINENIAVKKADTPFFSQSI